MDKKEILSALDALKAEVEKKPEDKVLEKLDQILKAIEALPHYYPYYCPYPHYQTSYTTYPNVTIGTSASGGTITTGSTSWMNNPNVTLTNAC